MKADEKMNWKKIKDLGIYLLVVALVIGIWLIFANWIDKNILLGDEAAQKLMAVKGQFGDKFGAVNSLFSGLAFAGIIITLLLQRRDLTATRDLMGYERFDNTFFELLKLHIDITNRINTKGGSGAEAFVAFVESTKRADPDFCVFLALQKIDRDQVRIILSTKVVTVAQYPEFDLADIANLTTELQAGGNAFQNYLDMDLKMHEKKVVNAYIQSCAKHIDYFSHYFRNLYHIFKFIDESTLIDEKQKIIYSKYVRSQLSDVELVCLFYNSISPILLPGREGMELGHPKMHKYLKDYDILQNMNPRSVFHPMHKQIFEKN